MELYNAPTRCWVRVISENKTPIASPHIAIDELIWFDHIDGMYSYCKNVDGEVVHLVAWSQVYVDEELIDEPAPERKTNEAL